MRTENTPSSPGRNYGIDLLRIVSMLMVVILHICGTGGILKNADFPSPNYSIAKFLEIASFSAVNCYALISGFVGFGSRIKISRILHLWLQVIFYCFVLTILCCIVTSQSLTPALVIKSIFPFTFGQYWYFSSYLAACPFFPLLNTALAHTEKKHDIPVAAAIVLLFSVSPITWLNDALSLNGGYSPIWLISLYILGALVRKYDVPEKCKCKTCFLLYLACTGFNLILHMLYRYSCTFLPIPDFDNYFVNYLSPTVLLSALALLCLFSRLKLSGRAQNTAFKTGSHAFAVYLIHTHPLIFQYFFTNQFECFAHHSPFLMLLEILLCGIFVWGICMVIDSMRNFVFKLLKITHFCTASEQWLHARYTGIQ